MAEGLIGGAIVRAVLPTRLHSQIAVDAEEEPYRMDGADPFVQLFNGASEEKGAPNYSDYIRWREERLALSLTVPDEVTALDILREAYPEGL